MKKIISAIFLGVTGSSAALYAASPSLLTTATSPVAFIDNGQLVSNVEIAPYNSVVKVLFNGSLCTGTMIQYNAIITAGHCAIDFNTMQNWTLVFILSSAPMESLNIK
ncbi:trypsin-like serine protease [Facilibium subflavum]|uniref:trypsin-like serine protease n=1 Tax=Facilibium subflavum TaxID=2219058 RepID=UPI000E65E78B|nr:trypsin-like serine protease [Facilibium subflavum]